MKETEKRCYGGKEFRAVETTQGEKIVEGHAAVFNQPTSISGAFIEVIERGAFDNCDLSDVALFVNHDAGQIPLARTTSGTLSLTVDDVGLAIRAKLDVENNPAAKSLYSSVSRGDISKMSFAFTVDEDEWQNLNSDMPTRRIKKFSQIFEVSCVTYPAYPQTDLNARKRKEEKNMTYEEFQKHMKRYQADKTADNEEEDERTRLINELEAHPEKFKRADKQPPNFIPGKGFIPANESRDKTLDSALEQREKAGKDLKERRAVESMFNIFGERRTMTVTPAGGETASLVVPNYSSSTIKPDFPFVSSLVDAVAHLSLNGGESFTQPYLTGIGTGGKINGINFIICSDCKPLTGASTQSGEFSMCYGNLANYLLCEFSPLEVKRSDDFKFRKGITCFRGSAIVGGNCVKKNGFIRIKKG